MKKILKFIIILLAYAMTSTPAYAGIVDVQFDAQSQDYNESLEIYLSNEEDYYVFKLGPDNAYSVSQEVEEGEYVVNAFSIGDANKYYSYKLSHEKLRVSETGHSNILVTLADSVSSDSSDDDSIPPVETAENVAAAIYDYSNGTDTGTLKIQCAYTSGVKEVNYKLMDDTGNELTVPLRADNMFEATILLPYGTYHEIGRPDIRFFDDCEISPDYRYTWIHTDSNYFGKYYSLDSTIDFLEFNDLAIVLHLNGVTYTTPDFWNLSITKKYHDNIVENINSIDQAVNADEYADINNYLKKAGQETIPDAAPVEEAPVSHNIPVSMMIMILSVICVFIITFVIYVKIRKRKH